MRSFEFFKLFYENFKKTIANFAYMWYTFSCSLKAITALVTENAVKLTDEVGFLTNYYMKRRKTALSVKPMYITLEPKISGGFNNGVKKSVSYRPARNS